MLNFPTVLLRKTLPAAFVALALGTMSGCSSSDGPEPVSRMLDTEAMSKIRLNAINRVWDAVEAGEVDHQQAREMLKRVAWSRSTYWSTRTAAIDALMKDTDHLEDTRAMFALLVPTEKVVEVLEKIGEISVRREWTNVAPSFVRAWDRNTQEVRIDEDRPEPAVLRAMFPDQTLAQTLFEVFQGKYQDGPGVRFGERDRRAAWGLLVRTAESEDEITELVRKAEIGARNDDPLMWAIAAAANRFRAVPQTAEQVAWIERLLTDTKNLDFVSEAERVVEVLPESARQGWQLRHLAPAVWASRFEPSLLTRSRSELISMVDAMLSSRETHFRDRTDTAWLGGESLDEWKDKLAWGDALALLIAARSVEDASRSLADLHTEIFRQADADNADTSTEYGGLLFAAAGGNLTAQLFEPRANSRYGDERFVASQELIDAADTALFMYHFHVTRTRNADYAGPSFDDFEFVRREGRASLLYTFVTQDRLNVDYYQPGGLRIDLGTIERP
ncbi:MAG: hypothetical protein ACF8MJ_13120 [Phycisphaerales bacterium JB050]